jgi:hypothetical protein
MLYGAKLDLEKFLTILFNSLEYRRQKAGQGFRSPRIKATD